MNIPKKVKYKKWQVKKVLGFYRVWSKSNKVLALGFFGLRARSCGILNSKQIENLRITIGRIILLRGSLHSWFHVYPHIPITKKATGVRMGKGKGAVRLWTCAVSNGIIILELGNVDLSIALRAFKAAKKKLPFRTDIIIR
jgi:large subunit ribosomal protein L16